MKQQNDSSFLNYSERNCRGGNILLSFGMSRRLPRKFRNEHERKCWTEQRLWGPRRRNGRFLLERGEGGCSASSWEWIWKKRLESVKLMPRALGNHKKGVNTEWRRQSLSRVWLSVSPWTMACQIPLFVKFSRQEYWIGLPFPSPGDLPHPGIEPRSPVLQEPLKFNSYRKVLSCAWRIVCIWRIETHSN